MRRFVITIDTEADCGPGWVGATPESYRNIDELRQTLLPSVSRWAAPATLLINGDVIERDAPSRMCEVLSRQEGWELGAHLHGELEEPERRYQSPAGVRLFDRQCFYSSDLESAKMEALQRKFTNRFGFAPQSFRAGRYGASERTLQICARLGYSVDSSVAAGVRLEEDDAVLDFRRWGVEPWVFDGAAGPLVEIPITVQSAAVPHWRGQRRVIRVGHIRMRSVADRVRKRAFRLARSVTAMMLGTQQRPVWLRPSYSSAAQMRSVLHWLVERTGDGPVVANMMFHSNELLAGASPYNQTEQDVRDFMGRLAGTLEEARRLGFQFCTLKAAAQRFKPGSAE